MLKVLIISEMLRGKKEVVLIIVMIMIIVSIFINEHFAIINSSNVSPHAFNKIWKAFLYNLKSKGT